VLAAAAEHERHVIGERTRHALAAAKARGVKLGNPEQAKINRVKAAAGLKRCARTSSAAYRTSSSAIATDLRHRMAANGFRCRFVASAIVSAYDDRGHGRALRPRDFDMDRTAVGVDQRHGFLLALFC
jgi:hypothetical protein